MEDDDRRLHKLKKFLTEGTIVDEATREAMKAEHERVQAILASIEEIGRAVLDDESEMVQMRTLIRVTVEFHDFLWAIPPWPHFPDDPFQNMTYMVDKILIHADWFMEMMHTYGILVGAGRTTIDWDSITAQSLKDRFLALYDEFLVQKHFQKMLRLLLDLYKLQIVYAGIHYDSKP